MVAETLRERARVEVVAAAMVALALVGVDLAIALARAPHGPLDVAGALGFLCAGFGVGTLLFSFAALVRLGLRHVAANGFARAIPGVVDGVALYGLAVALQDPRPIGDDLRPWILALAIVVGASVGPSFAHRARLRRAFSVVCGVVAVGALAEMPWAGSAFTRLAADLVLAASSAEIVRPIAVRTRVRTAVAGALAVASLVAAFLLLGLSEPGRSLAHHRSTHVRTWLGFVDAIHGEPASAPQSARTTRAPAPGPVRDDDVLLLSLDSLRWDLADDLPALSKALGARAVFSRAVSPAPHTPHSIGAMLRGTSLRRLRLDPVPDHTPNPWRDPSPTLGRVLVESGWRAVSVRTDRYLDPALGVTTGFETLWLTGPEASRAPAFPGLRSVRAPDALALVRRAARETKGPLCAFVHFMDTHAPYRWGASGEGPADRSGLRHAVRDLDGRLAAFFADFVRLRGRRPLVAVLGDHGEAFGEHGAVTHSTSVYAEQARVVLSLAGEGIGAGRFDAPVSTASVPPTLLEILGVARPSSMTAPSLVAPLGGRAPWPAVAVSEVRSAGWTAVAYTGARYRLVVDRRHRIEELFDSRTDPLEEVDRKADLPGELAAMRRLAGAWDSGGE